MWRWAEHLELFKSDSDANVSCIRTVWRKASESENKGEIISTNLHVFDDALTNQLENLQLVHFGRALYRAYRTNLEQALGFGLSSNTCCEQGKADFSWKIRLL